jgi:hypothetical protein
MVTEGEQVVVADVGVSNEVAYEVLCRRHHMRGVTALLPRQCCTSHTCEEHCATLYLCSRLKSLRFSCSR